VVLGNLSCCNVVQKLKIDSENIALNIKNAHKNNQTKAFSVKYQEIYYLPQGIGKSFKNLTVLEIINSSLTKITSKNLQEFIYLKYLSLSNNNIKYLESNLFKHNTILNTVNLNYNHISLIEPTFLKTKNYLNIFTLEGNVCFSGTAGNKAELENMIEVIKIACSSVVQNINSNLQENHNKIEACDNDQLKLNKSIKILTNKIYNHTKMMTDYEKEIGDMKKKIEVNLESFDNLQTSLNKVESNSKTFINKINDSLKTCPSSAIDLNKTVAEVKQNCTLSVKILENKYTEILNKTINMEIYISISRSNVNSNENKIKKHEADLVTIKRKSNNLSIDLNKIWIEINRTNGESVKQKADLTKAINKDIKDLQNKLVQNLANLTNKVESTEIHLIEYIDNHLKNITNKMNIKFNDFKARFNEKLEMLINNTNVKISVKIAESRKDIETLTRNYHQTIEKLAKYRIKIENLIKKDEEIEKRLLKFAKSKDVHEIISNKSNELNQSLCSTVRTELDLIHEKLQNNTNNFNLVALNLNEKLENQSLNFNDILMNQMHQDSAKQMANYVIYLIISNIILIVLLVLTFSCLIYSLKFKINPTNTKQIQLENSNYQQFNTISTHVRNYDQNIEPVYATTDFNEEPIYEAYEDLSLYTIGDPLHYEATDDQGDKHLYEATDDSTVQEQNRQSYECVGQYEASIYDTMTNDDDQHYKDDTSQNDIENAVVYECGDDSIYEAAERVGTMKVESMTSIPVSDEELYAEIPIKMNDEQEKVDESEIYAAVRKN